MTTVVLTPVSALRRWMRFRRNVEALGNLDDRMLCDIGLTRTAIESAAWADAR